MSDPGGPPVPRLRPAARLPTRLWTPRSALAIAGLAAVGAGTLWLGFLTLFSTFAPYDDEGYFLISLKGYLGGATLYNDVYGQYGPFYFELMAGIFRLLGLPVTNDSGRVVTLVLWFGAAALVGAVGYRLSRSLVIAAVADVLAFRVASLAPNESMHPGHLLMFLLAAMAAAAALLVERRPRLALGLIGALAAMALLSKANIGALAIASIVFACVLASPRLLRARPLAYVVAAAFVLTPAVLMAKNVAHTGYLLYGIHVTLCTLAVALVALSSPRPPGDDRGAAWWPFWAAAGAIALTVVVVGVVVVQGTTISALLHGMVLDALNQTNVFSSPLQLPSSTVAWDAAAVAAALAVARLGLPEDDRWRALTGVLRIAAGIWLWADVIGSNPLGIPATLVWVAAVPTRGEASTPAARFVRVFLPALAVLQTLHAYPVPGSQVQWAALLLVPIGAICVGDGWSELGAAATSRGLRERLAIPAALGLVIWAGLTAAVFPLQSARDTYKAGVSLGEPGVRWIHVPAATAATYQGLTAAIKSHCRTFISSPGFGSLYVMTGDEPPTWINISGWLFSFDAKTQERAVAQVENVPGLCAVRNPDVEAFWAEGRPIPQLALYKFITGGDFRTIDDEGGFELMVRKTG